MKNTAPPVLIEPLALSLKEAARALGMSERHLRSQLAELPHVYIGSRVVIPVEALRKWLEENAEIRKGRIDTAVEEVLQGFEEEDEDES